MTGLIAVLHRRDTSASTRRRPSCSLTTMDVLKFLSFVLVLCSTLPLTIAKSESRVVCYYTNWSAYRQGPAKFLPDNINPYLCTHLIYAFGGLTLSDSGIKPFDKYQDIDKGGYTKFNGLKTYNKALKTLIAIGGWNEGSGRFSKLVADADSRKTFIKHSIRFLRQYHFDGLDLDWEYPAARDGGEPEDKKHYALFIKELREAFEEESKASGRARLLLTIAVPAGIEWIEKGYDIPTINKNVDFFNLLTYDYHASTEPTVNHHAPLKPTNGFSEYDYKNQLNIEYTISHYLQEGASADKLVVGLPTYGRSYTLFNIESSDVGAPASGPGTKGKYTKEPGYLAYYEICEGVKSGEWAVENSESDAQGPHAVNNDQWIGYDDPRIMAVKAKWVREMKLGGIMFWSVDNDDFRGSCHGKPFPLIEAAKTAYYTGETPPRSSGKAGTKSASRASTARPSTRRTTTTPAPPSTTTAGPASSGRRKKNKNKDNSRRRRPKTTAQTTTTPSPVTSDPLRTPPPPTTPDPGVEFECKDEGFFPHPRDCKKYFWCLDAPGLGLVAHHFTCPAGLFFNKLADSCDYARNVPCKPGGAATTTSTTTEAPTTTSTTTSAPDDDEYYDDEDEEEVVVKPRPRGKAKDVKNQPKSVQEIKDIKNLLSIIRKLGGVEELEKYLADNPGVSSDLVEEYEDEGDDDDEEEEDQPAAQVKTSTPKPPTAAASIFPNRNRFTPTAASNRAKFTPSNRFVARNRSPTSEESEEAVVVVEATTVQSKPKPFRPKYVTLQRSTTASKEKTNGPSSTETSVVVRFSNEEKLLEEQSKESDTTEKPDRYVTISRPYAKVNGVLEHEKITSGEEKVKEVATDNRLRYVTLARSRFSAAPTEKYNSEENKSKSESTSRAPGSLEDEESEEEYEKTEELVEEGPTRSTTTTTTTTVKPRIRIPSRQNGNSGVPRSRATTTTTAAPAVTPNTRSRNNFAVGARRNLLLERKRGSSTTTEVPLIVDDEGTDESIRIITASEPAYNRLNSRGRGRTRSTTLAPIALPTTEAATSSGRGRSRSRYTRPTELSTVNEIYGSTYGYSTIPPTTTLSPLSGSFQSAFIRRRTRRPTTTTESVTTTSTTTTTVKPRTTTTAEPVDYYYYYYDEEPINDNEELFAKSPSESAQSSQVAASNQFLRRSLEVETVTRRNLIPVETVTRRNLIPVERVTRKTEIPVETVTRRNLTPVERVTRKTEIPVVEQVTTKNKIPYRNEALVPLSNKIVMKKDGSVECHDVGVYPHPLSCKMYVNCVQLANDQGLRGWVYECSKHLTFNPIGGMCDWAPNQKDASVCHDLSFR